MSRMIKRLMVVLVAVFMFVGMVTTPVQAKPGKGNGNGNGGKHGPEPTVETNEPENSEGSEETSVTEETTVTEEPVAEEQPEVIAAENAEPEQEETTVSEAEAFTEEDTLAEEPAVTEEVPAEDVIEENEISYSEISDSSREEVNNALTGEGGFALLAENATENDGGPQQENDAPVFEKYLYDNQDGTYTLSLSITGQTDTHTDAKVNKANVILVIDTSSSMNSETGDIFYPVSGIPANPDLSGGVKPQYYSERQNNAKVYYNSDDGKWYKNRTSHGQGYNRWYSYSDEYTGTEFYCKSRFYAEKDALTSTGGIIDSLLEQNVPTDDKKKDIIEIAIAKFDSTGDKKLDFTTDASALKDTINGLTTASGTNWEEGLMRAKEYADSIHALQPNEKTYVIFLTDGQPTCTDGEHDVNTDYEYCWGEAKDDARALVKAGYEFYALFTWGDTENHYDRYLKGLVQYAYTETGSYNTSTITPSEYGKYYTEASSTEALIAALKQIVSNITTSVGYQDVGVEDGVTALTHSSISTNVGTGTADGFKYYRSGGDYGTADLEHGNYGQAWADAPTAGIDEETGNVVWNLGENVVLEDKVTYTVTFTVWPDQDALDLVADLNNGKVEYDNLNADQKASVQPVGDGEYTLKTNTDYPAVHYRTVTTVTTDGQAGEPIVSDRKKSEIDNPDPVGLLGQKITVEKKWADELDPDQKEEVQGQVVLDLYKKGETTPYIPDITLTEDNQWKIPNAVSIAPGMLITENSPAYKEGLTSVTYKGTTYYILEPGHDYKFQEDDINNHYELTAYEYHPMIIGNAVKNVTFEYDDNGNIVGITSINDMDTISATNTIKGGVNLSKKVVDANGNEVDTDDTFKITMHLQNPDGTPYAYDYRIYYGTKNPNYDNAYDQQKHRSDHIYGTGDVTVTLYVGDTIRFVNMEAGTRFYAEENPVAGYVLKGIDYTIKAGTETEYGNYSDEDKVVDGNITWYTVKGNSSSNVVVTNTHPGYFYVYHSSDNTVEKISLSDDRLDANRKFSIVNEVKTGHLYGGYYHGYSKAVMTDGKIKTATYNQTGTSGGVYTTAMTEGKWIKDEDGAEKYVGKPGIWDDEIPYTTTVEETGGGNGTEMTPVANTVYYLKEVPNVYLTPATYVVYDERDVENGFMQVKKLHLMSLTDDGNYKDVGFDVVTSAGINDTGSHSTNPDGFWGTQVNVTKLGTAYDTITSSSIVNGKEGLVVDLDVTKKYIKKNAFYKEVPYHVTPDNVKVTAIKQMVVYLRTTRFKNWTKPGMNKSVLSKKAAYTAVTSN